MGRMRRVRQLRRRGSQAEAVAEPVAEPEAEKPKRAPAKKAPAKHK